MPENELTKIECKLCGHSFNSQAEMKSHVMENHPEAMKGK
jgi:Zn ribbon nucleic-acid-binding protein